MNRYLRAMEGYHQISLLSMLLIKSIGFRSHLRLGYFGIYIIGIKLYQVIYCEQIQIHLRRHYNLLKMPHAGVLIIIVLRRLLIFLIKIICSQLSEAMKFNWKGQLFRKIKYMLIDIRCTNETKKNNSLR